VVLAALAGCSGNAIDVELRVPGGDHPLAGADEVNLALRDGSGALLAFSRTPATNGALSLPSVARGSGYTVEVDATFASDVIARGRSCAFDVGAGSPPPVGIWFSRIGRFATTSGPASARGGAVELAWGGGALVAGGSTDGGAVASTEVYDVATGRFGSGPALATPRAGARAVDLGDGIVLVIGGAAKGAPGLEALTASHSTAEPAGFAPDVVEHAAARTGDGSVVVAGGRVDCAVIGDAWIVSQGGATVEALPPLLEARAGAVLIAASSDLFARLFVVGGLGAGGAPVAAVEIYDPASASFIASGMSLVTPRAGHTVTRLPTGLLLVVGGVDAGGAPVAAAELLDPINGQSRAVANLRVPRSAHAATMLPSGRVLVTGGIGADGNAVADVEIFETGLGSEGDFVPTAPLATPRAGHDLVPLCDGTWLVAGGGSGAEIYNPL
jgi:hypothetical protein